MDRKEFEEMIRIIEEEGIDVFLGGNRQAFQNYAVKISLRVRQQTSRKKPLKKLGNDLFDALPRSAAGNPFAPSILGSRDPDFMREAGREIMIGIYQDFMRLNRKYRKEGEI